jgi:hypothetical protein
MVYESRQLFFSAAARLGGVQLGHGVTAKNIAARYRITVDIMAVISITNVPAASAKTTRSATDTMPSTTL